MAHSGQGCVTPQTSSPPKPWLQSYFQQETGSVSCKPTEGLSFVDFDGDIKPSNGTINNGTIVSHTMRHQHQMLSLTCGIWKKDSMNFFAEQILTHRLWKTDGFQRRQVAGVGDGLGIWDGNAIKLDCDDHHTTINVIKFTELKK